MTRKVIISEVQSLSSNIDDYLKMIDSGVTHLLAGGELYLLNPGALPQKSIRVVNVRKEQSTHFVGRKSSYKPSYGLKNYSVLGNPYYMANEGMRNKVCDDFEEYYVKKSTSNIEFMMAVNDLVIACKDGVVTVGCFCFPCRCHANTIAKDVTSQFIKLFGIH